ncbi:hypothetical protein Tco_0561621 [Tanacetum coccineum]
MKAVRSSSHVSIVPSLSSSNHDFASPVSNRRDIIRRTASFSVSVFKHITYSGEFVNVFVRIGFSSTIKLISLDESQVVTFNGEFIYGFGNGDCGTGSRSDNTVCSSHRFIIHGIVISKNIKEVAKIIDVENWRINNSRVLGWIVSLFEWNSFVSLTKSSIQTKSLQFEHSAFSRLSADPEALIEELGGVEGPREELGGVEGLGDKHRRSRISGLLCKFDKGDKYRPADRISGLLLGAVAACQESCGGRMRIVKVLPPLTVLKALVYSFYIPVDIYPS